MKLRTKPFHCAATLLAVFRKKSSYYKTIIEVSWPVKIYGVVCFILLWSVIEWYQSFGKSYHKSGGIGSYVYPEDGEGVLLRKVHIHKPQKIMLNLPDLSIFPNFQKHQYFSDCTSTYCQNIGFFFLSESESDRVGSSSRGCYSFWV